MKIRFDFVTNSSSTSYIAFGGKISNPVKLLKCLMKRSKYFLSKIKFEKMEDIQPQISTSWYKSIHRSGKTFKIPSPDYINTCSLYVENVEMGDWVVYLVDSADFEYDQYDDGYHLGLDHYNDEFIKFINDNKLNKNGLSGFDFVYGAGRNG